MMDCEYCQNITTYTASSDFRQINGIIYYFQDNTTLKRYVKRCCMLKYGFNEPNRPEEMYIHILNLMKVKNPKYIKINNTPIMVFEFKFKTEEKIVNPFNYPLSFLITTPVVNVRRGITPQPINISYSFITKKQYSNLLNITNIPIQINISNNTNTNTNYVYLLQDRTAVEANIHVYKIGKSTQENYKRFAGYNKGFKLLLHIACDNCHEKENQIIESFKNKYTPYTKYGSEYFSGDPIEMMKDICSIVFN